jgi:nucleoside-diphosphate-sugar epimerase
MLVPWLLADGHKVTVFDTLLFGAGLPESNDSLTIIKADIRDTKAWDKACKNQDACIYLASISRELMCQKNESLAHEINVEAFAPAVKIAHAQGIKRFIYASSVAIYGSSDHEAKESEPLQPPSARQPIYGRGKVACEKVLLDYKNANFCWTVTRSASVCGYSTRQRLDITVNRMVHDACRLGVITVEGGEQVRSHIHMLDLCDFYRLLLKTRTDIIDKQAFNVVAQNQKVIDTAEVVASVVGSPAMIKVVPRVDDRSYAVDGTKAREVLGFVPKRNIEQAVRELKVRFDAGYWPDSLTNSIYQNMAYGLV